MLYTFIAIVAILTAIMLRLAWQRDEARAENRHNVKLLDKANRRLKHYEPILDYVLRHFSLNVTDPYIIRPGFEEKRCYHCF